MFMRATRIQVPPESSQASIDNFERILSNIRSAPGCLGGLLLVDRQKGSCIGVTYWDSAKSLANSELLAIQARSESVQAVPGAHVVNVERAELLILDRAAPPAAGTFVRLNTVAGDIDKQDALTGFVRGNLPVLKPLKGYRACTMAVDRQTGISRVSTVWESMADLEASEMTVAGLREHAARTAGATEPTIVEIFEASVVELSAVAAAMPATAGVW